MLTARKDLILGSDSMIAYWIVQRCVSKQPILPTVVDCMRSLIVMVLPRCVVVVELLTKALLKSEGERHKVIVFGTVRRATYVTVIIFSYITLWGTQLI